jgi:hypothetical protein
MYMEHTPIDMKLDLSRRIFDQTQKNYTVDAKHPF